MRWSLLTSCLFLHFIAFGQISPPGYEREMEKYKAEQKMSPLERDSVTLIDTIQVFDPETYESTTNIIVTNYSLKDYCKNFLAITDPDILLDGKPHKIIDPRTFEDIIIRLNASGKIDTIPQ
jgi:hypothetical protein